MKVLYIIIPALIINLGASFKSPSQNLSFYTSYDNQQLIDTVRVKKNINNVELPMYATKENLQNLLDSQKAAFVHFGFLPYYDKELEKKYGIKIINEGCVITPILQKTAKLNNILIADYLTTKFGLGWKNDLKIKPLGLD